MDPGRVLARLEDTTGAMATHTSQALREHEHGTAIDQLRVALSRTTETRAFVDVAGDDAAHALSSDLLEDADGRVLPPSADAADSPLSASARTISLVRKSPCESSHRLGVVAVR